MRSAAEINQTSETSIAKKRRRKNANFFLKKDQKKKNKTGKKKTETKTRNKSKPLTIPEELKRLHLPKEAWTGTITSCKKRP